MRHLSRRTVLPRSIGSLRLAGAALVGRSNLRFPLRVILIVLVAGLLAPAHAGFPKSAPAHASFPKIRFFVNQSSYEPGQTMRLKLKEGVKRHLRVRLTDSTGTVWRKVLRTDRKQVWKATAKQVGTRTVTIRMKRSDGRVFRRAVDYTVAATTRRRRRRRRRRSRRRRCRRR